MGYCKHCGNALPEGVKFCPACGKSLQPPMEDAPAAPNLQQQGYQQPAPPAQGYQQPAQPEMQQMGYRQPAPPAQQDYRQSAAPEMQQQGYQQPAPPAQQDYRQNAAPAAPAPAAPQQPAAQKKKKNVLAIILAVLLVLALAAGGYFAYRYFNPPDTASNEDEDEKTEKDKDKDNNKDSKDGETEKENTTRTAETAAQVTETEPVETEPVTQPEKPEPAGPEKVTTADLRFTVGGISYSWPLNVSLLTADRGWEKANDDTVTPDTVLQPGEYAVEYYGNEDAYVVLIVEYYNDGNAPKTLSECGIGSVSVVGGVLYSEPDWIPSDVGLTRGTTGDSYEDDIIAAFGDPDQQHSIYYEYDDAVEEYVVYDCGSYSMYFSFTEQGVMTSLTICKTACLPDFNNY